MHNPTRGEIAAGHADLVGRPGTIDLVFSVDAGLEGATVAVFHDDVAVVGGIVDVEEGDDVRVAQHF